MSAIRGRVRGIQTNGSALSPPGSHIDEDGFTSIPLSPNPVHRYPSVYPPYRENHIPEGFQPQMKIHQKRKICCCWLSILHINILQALAWTFVALLALFLFISLLDPVMYTTQAQYKQRQLYRHMMRMQQRHIDRTIKCFKGEQCEKSTLLDIWTEGGLQYYTYEEHLKAKDKDKALLLKHSTILSHSNVATENHLRRFQATFHLDQLLVEKSIVRHSIKGLLVYLPTPPPKHMLPHALVHRVANKIRRDQEKEKALPLGHPAETNKDSHAKPHKLLPLTDEHALALIPSPATTPTGQITQQLLEQTASSLPHMAATFFPSPATSCSWIRLQGIDGVLYIHSHSARWTLRGEASRLQHFLSMLLHTMEETHPTIPNFDAIFELGDVPCMNATQLYPPFSESREKMKQQIWANMKHPSLAAHVRKDWKQLSSQERHWISVTRSARMSALPFQASDPFLRQQMIFPNDEPIIPSVFGQILNEEVNKPQFAPIFSIRRPLTHALAMANTANAFKSQRKLPMHQSAVAPTIPSNVTQTGEHSNTRDDSDNNNSESPQKNEQLSAAPRLLLPDFSQWPAIQRDADESPLSSTSTQPASPWAGRKSLLIILSPMADDPPPFTVSPHSFDAPFAPISQRAMLEHTHVLLSKRLPQDPDIVRAIVNELAKHFHLSKWEEVDKENDAIWRAEHPGKKRRKHRRTSTPGETYDSPNMIKHTYSVCDLPFIIFSETDVASLLNVPWSSDYPATSKAGGAAAGWSHFLYQCKDSYTVLREWRGAEQRRLAGEDENKPDADEWEEFWTASFLPFRHYLPFVLEKANPEENEHEYATYSLYQEDLETNTTNGHRHSLRSLHFNVPLLLPLLKRVLSDGIWDPHAIEPSLSVVPKATNSNNGEEDGVDDATADDVDGSELAVGGEEDLLSSAFDSIDVGKPLRLAPFSNYPHRQSQLISHLIKPYYNSFHQGETCCSCIARRAHTFIRRVFSRDFVTRYTAKLLSTYASSLASPPESDIHTIDTHEELHEVKQKLVRQKKAPSAQAMLDALNERRKMFKIENQDQIRDWVKSVAY